eukprot:m.188174 g.188174  ORF g.188174 m.188174 type:complete len:145 (+) comp10556_c0_seq7:965-1399(+)
MMWPIIAPSCLLSAPTGVRHSSVAAAAIVALIGVCWCLAAYATIRTPLRKVEGGFLPDPRHRFFVEDVPYGLLLLKGLAVIAGVKTHYIDEILLWAQDFIQKEYLVDGELRGRDCATSGLPQAYGLHSIQQIVHGSGHRLSSKL